MNGRVSNPYFARTLYSMYSIESISASYEAEMMFSDTPTVYQDSSPLEDSMRTRVRALVAAWESRMRTL